MIGGDASCLSKIPLNRMQKNTSIVVTSIASPNQALRQLAAGSIERHYRFYVIGDVASPPDFHLEGCEFFDLARQRQLGFATAERCPERHYARKNIGYLQAIRDGATRIIETDDDNIPQSGFWEQRPRTMTASLCVASGWVNVYRYFTDENIWPRGLPLQFASSSVPPWESLAAGEFDCPIQQGLADENPDVDAIYRLVLPLPVRFRPGRCVALATGAWCPFNSQNTVFWQDAYPLLYLPAYCSFRMTDIWRSFIAQRICWENGWSVLFHDATVLQERNEHDLMKDFRDELPGYLQNHLIREILEKAPLRSGAAHIGENLRRCYEALVAASIVSDKELPLLDAWLHDLALINSSQQNSTREG